ncbi:InlB B-repeat-containing protein, partial [Paenibacillus agri]
MSKILNKYMKPLKWFAFAFICVVALLGAPDKVANASILPPGNPEVIEMVKGDVPANIPPGKKTVCQNDSNMCPTVQWGRATYWIYSDINNDYTMTVAAYNSSGALLGYKTFSGARYINKITLNETDRTVTLIGQDNNEISFNWDELVKLLAVTRTTVSATKSTFLTGETVHVTFKVDGYKPSGSVMMKSQWGDIPLPLPYDGSGIYLVQLMGLSAGNYTIGAEYLGNDDLEPSTADSITITVVSGSTVSFDVDGGTSVDPIREEVGKLIIKPTSPTKSGYAFAGWYKDAQFSQAWDFGVDTVPGNNITLYAKWDINQYKVNYDSNGGSAVVSETVEYGKKVVEPAAPTKSGY